AQEKERLQRKKERQMRRRRKDADETSSDEEMEDEEERQKMAGKAELNEGLKPHVADLLNHFHNWMSRPIAEIAAPKTKEEMVKLFRVKGDQRKHLAKMQEKMQRTFGKK